MVRSRVTLNNAAFNDMRNSQGVKDALNREAERIAAAAGPGFEVDEATDGATRAHARVWADTLEAKASQAAHHTLERAFGGA